MSTGSFLSGAITGIVGLGVVSWLLASSSDNETAREESAHEEE